MLGNRQFANKLCLRSLRTRKGFYKLKDRYIPRQIELTKYKYKTDSEVECNRTGDSTQEIDMIQFQEE